MAIGGWQDIHRHDSLFEQRTIENLSCAHIRRRRCHAASLGTVYRHGIRRSLSERKGLGTTRPCPYRHRRTVSARIAGTGCLRTLRIQLLTAQITVRTPPASGRMQGAMPTGLSPAASRPSSCRHRRQAGIRHETAAYPV